MKILFAILTSVFFALSLMGAHADSTSHDHQGAEKHGIMVKDLTIRATTPQAGATAAYAIIHNHSHHDDILLGASVSFAKKTEIHEMALVGDVMKMRQLEEGIAIAAGETIALEKGGNHIMMMGLSAPIKLDDTYEITLHFKKAGMMTLAAETISLAGKKATHSHQH